MKLEEANEDLGQGVSLEMVLIQAGTFMMGSPWAEEGRSDNERQHRVTLTKSYYMGKYAVTQEQFEAVMGPGFLWFEVNHSFYKGAKLPVTNVSWQHCQEFIEKLNAKTDGGYRLPTEAEWEYACRAGTTTAYSFGDEITPQDANYAYQRSETFYTFSILGKPVAVGSYKPNAFGLYDMHGNVWEWCNDWYSDYANAWTPQGPAKDKGHVMRGGSFNFSVSAARSSSRTNNSNSPTLRHYDVDIDLGFRLSRTADIKTVVVRPVPKPNPAGVMPATGRILVAPFTEAKAKLAQKEVMKNLQKQVEEKEDLGKGIKLDLVLIPAGKFMMGSPPSEKGRRDNETQHEVTLMKPFYLGKYEVTQEQWEGVMGNNPSFPKGAKLPVTNVSWQDCQEFIKKLNATTNGDYRLPTEAEWEYACRAGTTTAYSYGDKINPKDANYNTSLLVSLFTLFLFQFSKAIGSYKPNAFGLYDMHGNVWEWCEDWYADYPAGALTDSKGPAMGKRRVLRGGSFITNDSWARSSFRNNFRPADRYSFIGFRLAKTP